jgi:hypothetical protein
MSRRPMARLATVVTAAGAIAALGAATALAAPSNTWSGPSGAVGGARTNTTPAVSSIDFPNPIGNGTIVAWRGRGQNTHIYYKFKTPQTHHWSALGVIPGAVTNSAPAIQLYEGGNDPLGHPAVVAFWTGPADHHIFYSEGETHANGTIDWTGATALPSSVANTGSNDGPSIIFPNNNNVVIVGWRAPFNHVRFTVGTPAGRGFSWSPSHVVPNPPTTSTAHCVKYPCTSATPSLAEVENGPTGTLYIVWKQLGSHDIFYSTATDASVANYMPSFSVPTQVPGAVTTVAPSASAVPPAGTLLLVYKAPFSTHVKFQILTGATWSSPANIPTAFTAVGPTLRGGTLATTTPTTIGRIILHFFS